MRKFWQIEFPVGEACRGPAFGERLEPATIATITAVGSLLGGGAAVLNATGALGGKKSSAPPPVVEKPLVMPEPDDDAVKMARRRSLASQSARQGRASTILSDDYQSETLGA